ncbi:hypothetical protein [Kitasatospora cineracea]|uniref:hypothetical protein n=1 Tax=Kitasatospora cineracea TaxID=88074 RepID=UPI0037A1C6D1
MKAAEVSPATSAGTSAAVPPPSSTVSWRRCPASDQVPDLLVGSWSGSSTNSRVQVPDSVTVRVTSWWCAPGAETFQVPAANVPGATTPIP